MQELAEQVVGLDTQIKGRLLEISQQRRVKLSIGMSPVHGRIILPCILPQFYQENPDVTLNLTLDKSEGKKENRLTQDVSIRTTGQSFVGQVRSTTPQGWSRGKTGIFMFPMVMVTPGSISLIVAAA